METITCGEARTGLRQEMLRDTALTLKTAAVLMANAGEDPELDLMLRLIVDTAGWVEGRLGRWVADGGLA